MLFNVVNSLHGKKSSTCCNVVMNRIEQCCAAHIVQGCQQWLTTLLHAIQPQQYCSTLLTTVNNMGSTTLFNPVELQAHDFLPCRTMWAAKYCSILFSSTWNKLLILAHFLLCTSCTRQKIMSLQFNRIEQCCAAHIVYSC